MEVVTVFGASGFIGRYVVQELAKSGVRVRAAVRLPERAGFLRPMGDVGQVTPIAANIRDDASVAAAVDGADTVINLVGILYETGKQTFGDVQADGARRVAAAAKAAGARRFVQMSAIGADAGAESHYAASKGAGEELVRDIFPSAAVVRPSVVFGQEDEFFNKFAALARLAPALPLIGGGQTQFQPVYVGDVAEAIATIVGDEQSSGMTYELGGPQIYSFKDLMEIVLDGIGRRRFLVPVPFLVAMMQAAVLELSPFPPLLTRDQVRLLRHDNIVTGDLPGLDDLGIEATAVETIVPTYLNRYRRGVWHT